MLHTYWTERARRGGAPRYSCARATRPIGAVFTKAPLYSPPPDSFGSYFFPEIPDTRMTLKQWVSVPLLAPHFLLRLKWTSTYALNKITTCFNTGRRRRRAYDFPAFYFNF